jgi:S-adenosyl-L-methionine hydrolase (adenosine-forming)
MTIITLLTDWGNRDHYGAMVKGKILSKIPDATVLDISHSIAPFNLNSAAFVLKNSFPAFPKGSIHIVDIASDATIEMPHIIVKYDGYHFIGADNGIFSLAFEHPPEEIIEIDIHQDSDTFTFPAYDVFVKVAQHIAEGNDISELGPKKKELITRIPLRPVTSENLIKGHVVYVDSYENVFTNIDKALFNKIGQKRPFRIIFGSSRYNINKINQSYKDVYEGDLVALFSATGHLQIAVSMGNAAGLLGLKTDDAIRVEFR